MASPTRELREALRAIAPGPQNSISQDRLGKVLRARKGKIVDGLRIEKDGETEGSARWIIIRKQVVAQ